MSSDAISAKFRLGLLLKKWFGVKVAGIGLSVGPFTSTKDEQTAIILLENFDFLSKGNAILTQKQVGIISFQIEKMCRNVEPKAYKKKETANYNN